jgi:hypothetical protein
MKKSISKFDNISYPIFTLKKTPFEVSFTVDKIYVKQLPTGYVKLLDDKTLPGDYFARLLSMENRVMFDFTCRNVQDLVLSKASWGIDNKAVIHDLTKKFRVPAEKRLIVKVVNNLVWVRNISYPFEIPTTENISIDDKVYATIVKINNDWLIRDFSYEPDLANKYVVV